jgi:hypothetical protein
MQNEYYLDSGKLVFAFSTETRYRLDNTNMALDFAKFEYAATARFYYQNDVPFHKMLSSKRYVPSSAYFLVACREYERLLSNRKIGSKNDE